LERHHVRETIIGACGRIIRPPGSRGAHFVSELTDSSAEKFWQRAWEMALGRHLRACGHTISTRPEGEPDYFFQADGQGVWVEAISPSPGPGLPRH